MSPTATRPRSATSVALAAGREALAHGRWTVARRKFLDALRRAESTDALEGLAAACCWLHAVDEMLVAHERAYKLHRSRGDARGAARLAAALAWDHSVMRDDPAAAATWLGRGLELVKDAAGVPEQGWLLLREVQFFRMPNHEFTLALDALKRIREIARDAQDFDLDMEALALEGVVLIHTGSVREGRRRLDQAATAAAGGEMRDEGARGNVLLQRIAACEATLDLDPAAQWCDALHEFADSHDLRPFAILCRGQLAALFIRRGEWARAEKLLGPGPQMPEWMTGISTLRRAELRRRQGRLDEARTLFESRSPLPSVQIGMAAIALRRGDTRAANELLERRLRALPADARLERGAALGLAVATRSALGDVARAADAARELRTLAKAIGTPGFVALADHADGLRALAAGDAEGARRLFAGAVDGAGRARLPFEAAESRLAMAKALAALGRAKESAAEQRTAESALRALGAESRGELPAKKKSPRLAARKG